MMTTIITFVVETINQISFWELTFFAVPFVFSLIVYFRSKRSKQPRYYIRTTKLIEDSVSKIGNAEINFNGTKIETLSVSRIAFWNWGKETIHGSDIAELDPIRIILKNEAKVLDVEIIHIKNVANGFEIDLRGGVIPTQPVGLSFEFIDKDEGLVIQIYHTGTKNEDIEIVGTIKGAGKVRQVGDFYEKFLPFYDISKMSRTKKRFLLGGLLFIAPPFAIVSDILVGPIDYKQTSWLILFALVALVYWTLAFLVIRSRLPRGLGLADEDFVN